MITICFLHEDKIYDFFTVLINNINASVSLLTSDSKLAYYYNKEHNDFNLITIAKRVEPVHNSLRDLVKHVELVVSIGPIMRAKTKIIEAAMLNLVKSELRKKERL